MTVLAFILSPKVGLGLAAILLSKSVIGIAAQVLMWKDNKNVGRHSLTFDQYLAGALNFQTRPWLTTSPALNYIS